jgi:phosphonate transport system substrate-binding protein
MMNQHLVRPTIVLSICSICFGFLGCSQPTQDEEAFGAATSSPTAVQTIVLADISDEPTETLEAFQPLADYLAVQLTQSTAETYVGQVKVAPDMATVAAWLKQGEVDLYFDSPYPSLIVSQLSGSQPILRRWKDGVSAYSSVIFTRSDTELQTLEDLEQHYIALEEAFSTSGYLLPVAYLIRAGLDPVEVADRDAPLTSQQVGYMFSKDEQNAIQWVLSGLADAAAVSEPDFEDISQETRDRLRILAKTEALPRHLVLVAPDMTPELRSQVTEILTSMDTTDAGQTVLQQFEETARIDKFPESLEAALLRMQNLYELVNKS